jgi:hypothetical protein
MIPSAKFGLGMLTGLYCPMVLLFLVALPGATGHSGGLDGVIFLAPVAAAFGGSLCFRLGMGIFRREYSNTFAFRAGIVCGLLQLFPLLVMSPDLMLLVLYLALSLAVSFLAPSFA